MSCGSTGYVDWPFPSGTWLKKIKNEKALPTAQEKYKYE
jgi:hypothetical protein